MIEDPIVITGGLKRAILVMICRNRQRLLKAAWRRWTENSGPEHDYSVDVSAILSRKIADRDMRTELEIEVLNKWIFQNSKGDPTGLPHMLGNLKS